MLDIESIDSAGPALWSVTRCGHGCLHLHLGRCSVTLSPEEFLALRDLLRRASSELRVEAVERWPDLAH